MVDNPSLIFLSCRSLMLCRFRWAALQLDRIKYLRIVNDGSVRALLEDVPDTLDATYARILLEVPPYFQNEALTALKWLVLACRPLFIEELQEVCALTVQGLEPFSQDTRWPVRDFLSLLPSLIVLDPWPEYKDIDSLVRGKYRVLLSHFSVKEYLLGHAIKNTIVQNFYIDPTSSHRCLSASCLTYLAASNSWEKRSQDYPLRDYAWNFWAMHAVSRTTEFDEKKEDEALQLFAEVSYQGCMQSLPEETVSRVQTIDLAKLKDRLMHPYFYPEYENYDAAIAPLDSTNELWANSLYEPKAISEETIHLLQLSPSRHKFTEIHCWPVVASVQEVPTYIAMSWAWSGSVDRHDFDKVIRVNGVPVQYPPNLVSHLRSLRHSEGDIVRPLWIDALSINQTDLEGRASTISVLGEIFRKAETVVVMLGDAELGDEITISIMQELNKISTSAELDTRELERLLLSHPRNPYRSLRSIFERTWWTRLWVLQEFVLPSRVSFVLGGLSFSSDVVENFVKHQELLATLLNDLQGPALRGLSPAIWLKAKSWQSVCEVTQLRLAIQAGEQFNFGQLLYLARNRICEDERDRVFSLKGMAVDAARIPIEYKLSIASLLTIVSKAFINEHGNLDHLSWISHSENSRGVPSWVSHLRFDTGPRVPLIKGSFVGKGHQDPFNVAKGTAAQLLNDQSSHADHIQLEGLTVSRIASLEDPLDKPFVHGDVFGCDDVLLQTYHEDRQRAQLASGHVGLVPTEARVRDEVVILKGGKVPYVIRPLLMAPNISKLIGEWYVLAHMVKRSR
jgi:Heterokaryon incompatibility protein (HET)